MVSALWFHPAQIPPEFLMNCQVGLAQPTVVGLTFKKFGAEDDEVSAIIDDKCLTLDSLMDQVLKEYNVAEEFVILDIDDCKFLVKRRMKLL